MSRTCCGLLVQECGLGLRLQMEGTDAPVVGIVVVRYWGLFGVVGLWDWVALEHSAGLCVGFVTGWEETAVAPWGGHHGSSDFSVVAAIHQNGWGWKHVYP